MCRALVEDTTVLAMWVAIRALNLKQWTHREISSRMLEAQLQAMLHRVQGVNLEEEMNSR